MSRAAPRFGRPARLLVPLAALAAASCLALVPHDPPAPPAPPAGAGPLWDYLTRTGAPGTPGRFQVNLGLDHGLRPGDRFLVLRGWGREKEPGPAGPPDPGRENLRVAGEAAAETVLPNAAWLVPVTPGLALRQTDIAMFLGPPAPAAAAPEAAPAPSPRAAPASPAAAPSPPAAALPAATP